MMTVDDFFIFCPPTPLEAFSLLLDPQIFHLFTEKSFSFARLFLSMHFVSVYLSCVHGVPGLVFKFSFIFLSRVFRDHIFDRMQ